MLEFILQYWLEILFGIVIGAFSWFLKRFFNLVKNEYAENQKAEIRKLQEEVQTKHDQQEEEIQSLKKGLLSLQRPKFIADCYRLLETDHVITPDEYSDIDADHEAYNGLGGNHQGDQLFALIVQKYTNQVTHN